MAPPEEEEEDDYMNMTFGDDAPGLATVATCSRAVETSLQRRQRLRREGEERGRVKSKAELAAEAAAAREEALSRSLLEGAQAKRNKGFAMMAKMGFKAGDALGAANNGNGSNGSNGSNHKGNDNSTSTSASATEDTRSREPIRLQMKEDRGGIGLDSDRKRKINEAAEQQTKRVKADETEYRERMRREREAARLEGQFYGAMKVCERMDEQRALDQGQGRRGDGMDNIKTIEDIEEEAESSEDEKVKEKKKKKKKKKKKALSTRQLKSIPVEWRGLIRKRQEAERDTHKMRYDLEQSSTTRLPTYADDFDGDKDDKTAMGKIGTEYVPVEEEDLEEVDEELEGFDALEVEERLRRVVGYLRREFHYCFWCKYHYPDEEMEGCPGATEEDHD